jgi:hypothetical protein
VGSSKALASVGPLSLRFSFHLQDVSSERVEFLFKTRLVEWVVAVGPFQSNIGPVLWPQRGKRGRKHDALLHVHVLPLLLDEVGNDIVHSLAQEILIAQHALNRLGNPAQTPRSSELRQAVLMAVENVGERYAAETAAERKEKGLPVDRNANRGTAAYLERIAHTHPSVMGALLSRILPSKVEGEHTVQHTAVAYTSYEEIANRLRELGLEPRRIYDTYPMIEAKKPEPDKVS